MDATVRRSSTSRVQTFIAITVLACISLIALFSGQARQPAGVTHSRRAVSPIHNEVTTGASVTLTPISDGFSSGTSTSVSSASISATTILSTTESTTTVTTVQQITTITTTSLSRITSGTPVESNSRDATTSTRPSIKTTSSDLSTTSSTQSPTPSELTSSTASPTITSIVESTKSVTTSTTRSPTLLASPDLQPATTLVLGTDGSSLPSSPSATIGSLTVSNPISTSSVSSTPTPVSAASKASGMWQNKGAVAAIFVIVSLVFLAIGAFAVITFLKRRSKRRQEQLHEELFEKYSENDHRSNSPGPSINAAPLDAFASREIGYTQSDPFHSSPVQETFRINQSSTPVQHPDYYNTTTPAQYISPSESMAAARITAAPSAFRTPVSRAPVARDSYQQSIDSFYGAAGQALPSGYAV